MGAAEATEELGMARLAPLKALRLDGGRTGRGLQYLNLW